MNWRSEPLLKHIRAASICGEAPCFWPMPHACTQHTPGTVVYGHSNQLRDGKGKSIKASDHRIALLCFTAHTQCDQGGLPQLEAFGAWEHAHRKTIGWLFEAGLVRAA